MGQVIAPFGIKGWLRIRTFTGEVDSLAQYSQWWLQLGTGWQLFQLADSSIGSKGMTALLAEIADRTQAEALRNVQIAVSRAELPELEDDEFYWADLIGFQVQTPTLKQIGLLDGLLETSAADVLVVKGATEQLIPAARIIEVDIDEKTIRVDWEPEY